MGALTVQDAARATGWSARMLRYIERTGLVVPPRSEGGYRLYGVRELERLRKLRDLLAAHQVRLDDLGFALRLREDGRLRQDVDAWLAATRPATPRAQPSTFEWLVATPRSHERLSYVA
ncbi:MAG: MerR family transcriptional regulator [Candidatus Dormibacteraceae bacterium]